MKKNKKIILGLCTIMGLAGFLSGCGNASNEIPPTPLQTYTPLLKAKYLYSRDIGNGNGERLDVTLTPAYFGDNIYTTSFDGYVGAIDAKDGKTRWFYHADDNISAPAAVDNDIVVIGTLHGQLVAINSNSGHMLWQAKLPGSLFSKPLINNGIIYVQTHDGSLSAYNEKDGTELWSNAITIPDLMLTGNSSPVIYKNLVIVGTSSGELWGFKADDGTRQWDTPVAISSSSSPAGRMVDIVSTPLVDNDTLYVATFQGNIASFNTDTGQLNWQKKASVFNNFAIGEGLFFVSDSEGRLIAYDKENGKINWQSDALIGRKTSAPLYVDNKVIVGDYDGFVHIFNAKTGQYLDRIDIGGDGIKAQPVYVAGKVFVQTNGGSLAAIQL
ncbi:MAG: outer membrane protein assembly factor BamB [Francisellaceae bacterium]